MPKEIELTDKQKEWILKHGESLNWDLSEITKRITGDKKKDGRSFEGKAVRKFILEEVGAKPKTKTIDPENYQAFQLDNDQEDFIRQNVQDMNAFEMSVLLWPQFKDIQANEVMFTKECKAVIRFIKENFGNEFFEHHTTTATTKFKPPKDAAGCVPLVAKFTGLEIKWSKLKDNQKNALEKLNKNLRRASLTKTLEQFKNSAEKDLFLESFIADTWDKDNLTPGEVSSYIDLAGLRTSAFQIKGYMQRLQEELDSDLTSEDGKLRYTLVEAIDKQVQNYDKTMTRIQKLQSDLEGTRTKRLEKEGSNTVTILSMCEELAKEDKRKRFVKMAKAERDKVSDKIDEYESMDSYFAKIYGADKDELLN